MATTLADTCATGYGFIDEEFAETVCQNLEIEPQRLIKPKEIQGFDGRAAKPITHAIYPTLTVGTHTESLAPLLITKLGNHPMILGRPWMKKHGVIIDMTNNSLAFWPGHCTHIGATFPLSPPSLSTETAAVRIEEDITARKIIKKGSKEDMTDFLQTPNKLSSKKRRQINKSMRKISIGETSSRKATISSLDSSDKKELPVPIPAKKTSEPKTKDIDIAMIGADAYRAACRLKGAQVFAVSMKDIQYQAEKEARAETNPKSVVPQEYYNFLDVFSKKNSDTLLSHQKYDHKIYLEEEQKPSHAPLYKMSPKELDAVKHYLNSHLVKRFIQASLASYSLLVLFVKKSAGGIRFCVDYKKLNAITKKDRYPIPLIEETLAQLEGAKYFTKIDIRQAFYRIRMSEDSEELTTFLTRFGVFKYLVMPFGLCNGPASWQHLINDTLFDFLHRFVQAYLDDILIYSKTLKEHRFHVRQVLQRLREAGLQADIDKCEFHVQETRFLGLIVSTEGIRMDPQKIQTILDWAQPTSLHHVRSFLGFCNFYRRFIRDFSKLAKPFTGLTKKDALFDWTSAC